jgi:hypothetical protein
MDECPSFVEVPLFLGVSAMWELVFRECSSFEERPWEPFEEVTEAFLPDT